MKPAATMLTVPGPHPACLDDATLNRQCRVTFGRGSGPGGQHRNKVETAACVTHEPTGVNATASERRSQSQNRHTAHRRLRMKLALKVRTTIRMSRYRPSSLWVQRRQGKTLPVNARNRDFPALLAEAIDVVAAMKFDVGAAAGVLGVTMSQLAKLLGREPKALAWVNDGRADRGLARLR